jgi:hypothetical protein
MGFIRMEHMNSSKASSDFFVLRGWFAGGKPSRFAIAPTNSYLAFVLHVHYRFSRKITCFCISQLKKKSEISVSSLAR